MSDELEHNPKGYHVLCVDLVQSSMLSLRNLQRHITAIDHAIDVAMEEKSINPFSEGGGKKKNERYYHVTPTGDGRMIVISGALVTETIQVALKILEDYGSLQGPGSIRIGVASGPVWFTTRKTKFRNKKGKKKTSIELQLFGGQAIVRAERLQGFGNENSVVIENRLYSDIPHGEFECMLQSEERDLSDKNNSEYRVRAFAGSLKTKEALKLDYGTIKKHNKRLLWGSIALATVTLALTGLAFSQECSVIKYVSFLSFLKFSPTCTTINPRETFNRLFIPEGGWEIPPDSTGAKGICRRYEGKWKLIPDENGKFYEFDIGRKGVLFYRAREAILYTWCADNGNAIHGLEFLTNDIYSYDRDKGIKKIATLTALFTEQIRFDENATPIQRIGQRIGRYSLQTHEPNQSNNIKRVVRVISNLTKPNCSITGRLPFGDNADGLSWSSIMGFQCTHTHNGVPYKYTKWLRRVASWPQIDAKK